MTKKDVRAGKEAIQLCVCYQPGCWLDVHAQMVTKAMETDDAIR